MNRIGSSQQTWLVLSFLLSIFFTIRPAMAASGFCGEFLPPRPAKIQRAVLRQKVLELTTPSRAFMASLHMRNPEVLVADGSHFRVDLDRSPYRTLHYWPFAEEGSWRQLTRHLLGWSILKDPMYASAYGNYEGRIEDEISSIVRKVEDKLSEDRLWFGAVRLLFHGEALGTIRIVNGTAQTLSGTTSSPELPFERIFVERGLLPQSLKKLREIRREKPNQPIYEIGKLSLDKNLSSGERHRVLSLMELMILERLVLFHPDALFYAHVASDAHLALYRRNWGWRIEETVDLPSGREYILTLTGDEFISALLRRLGMDRSALQYSPNSL